MATNEHPPTDPSRPPRAVAQRAGVQPPAMSKGKILVVAAYLRESLQTPVMFLSAFADDDTVAQGKALGAVAYLVKPLDIAQIVPTVEAALVTARARKAAAVPPAPASAPHEQVRPDPFAPSSG